MLGASDGPTAGPQEVTACDEAAGGSEAKAGKKENIRHAEKPRTASDAFADRIAEEAVAKYRALADLHPELGRGQTVVAAVLLITEGTVRCVSLASGTKFVPPEVIQADESGEVVRDCHAEVLARRGFQRWLRREGLPVGADVAFYTSSAPCGNACVKKWAKPRPRDPYLPHPVLNPSARREGQVAVLVKGEHSYDPTAPPTPVPHEGLKRWGHMFAPPGTTPCALIPEKHRPFHVATCSDKMGVWSVVGMQGALLAHKGTVRAKYVVVGRKYAEVTLARALCCRQKSPHHPIMLCTSVVLDAGVYKDGDGAQFDSPFSVSWVEGEAAVEIIDGTTGRLAGSGGPSRLSRSSVAREVLGGDITQYMTGKAKAVEYQRAKQTLFSNAKLLSPWPRSLDAHHGKGEVCEKTAKRPRTEDVPPPPATSQEPPP